MSTAGKKFRSLDAWDGYGGEREKILDFLIMLTGDKHASMVAEIPNGCEKPTEVLSVEFITPALSSINFWKTFKGLLQRAKLEF